MAGKFMVLVRTTNAGAGTWEAALPPQEFKSEAAARRYALRVYGSAVSLVVQVCDAEQQPRAGKALAASIAEKGDSA